MGGAAGWSAGEGGGQPLPASRGSQALQCPRAGSGRAGEAPSGRELAGPHLREVTLRVMSALSEKHAEGKPFLWQRRGGNTPKDKVG